ncbi:hypothetical protein MUP79_05220 [Candidatus Bathyarchaeota archaeon]|nr:hypothetical protein [Candidatus Bathyarchaeota archaeon]
MDSTTITQEIDVIILHVDDSFGAKWKGDYKFRGIAYGLYGTIIEQNSETNPLTGIPTKQNTRRINAEIVMGSLVSQPENKPLSLTVLLIDYIEEGGVPIPLAAKFVQCASEVSLITQQEKNQITLAMVREKPTPEMFQRYLCLQFGCLPSELRKENAKDILGFIADMEARFKIQPPPTPPPKP